MKISDDREMALLGVLVYWVVWSSRELCFSFPRLSSSTFDSLLIQFQVLSLKGKWLSIHQRTSMFAVTTREKCLQKRELKCPLMVDWINLPGSTVVSLSFCNSDEQ